MSVAATRVAFNVLDDKAMGELIEAVLALPLDDPAWNEVRVGAVEGANLGTTFTADFNFADTTVRLHPESADATVRLQ